MTKVQEFLTLVNYKEPLLSVSKSIGFGYYGAISITLDGTKMQCHVCGNLYSDVGLHSRQAHQLPVVDYKAKFQLARTTSLISEKIGEERKERTLRWLANLSSEQKSFFLRKQKDSYTKWLKNRPHTKNWKESLESKNKKGVCPEQFLLGMFPR